MDDREPEERAPEEIVDDEIGTADPAPEGPDASSDPLIDDEDGRDVPFAAARPSGDTPRSSYSPLLSTMETRTDARRPREGRASFLYDYDADSGERVPSKPRFAVAGLALVAAIVFGFWVVKAEQEAKPAAPPEQSRAESDRDAPVVRGQNLPRREPTFSPSSLEPSPTADQDSPPPPPEPVTAPAEPPPPAPHAPDSWRTSLAFRVTDVEGDDDDDDEEAEGPGVTLVEGTEIDAVLEGKIDAPDSGLDPDLNRVKAVLVGDYSHDGRVVFPAGTEFLGRVEQTTDKKIHVRFHRVVLPDQTSAPCKAIALDSDLSAGIRADKIEKYRKQNVLGRVGRGVVDGAASVAGFGRSGAGAIGAGAAAGAAAQGREETDAVRRPKRLFHVAAGRPIFIQLSADLDL